MSEQAMPSDDCKANEVEVLGGVTPYLQLNGAAKAAAFYNGPSTRSRWAARHPTSRGATCTFISM